jgi:hypothetical protein
VKNIPLYLENKKIIRKMEKDNISNEKELDGYIRYNKKRNSIKLALKEIISSKYRNSINALSLKDNSYRSLWLKNHNYFDYSKSLSK